MYFTGSKQHNIHIRDIGVKKGLKISEYGVFRVSTGRRIASATEEEVYAAVGLPWIPPELREDAGEIEAALDRRPAPTSSSWATSGGICTVTRTRRTGIIRSTRW